jgi:hypothetical protein
VTSHAYGFNATGEFERLRLPAPPAAARAWGLAGTELAVATAGTLRLRLLKIAAQVTVSVRRVYVRLCSAFPLQDLFAQCQARLAARAGA